MLKKIKNNSFAKNSFILFVGTMLASVLNYVFHLIIGRIVDVEVYGEVQSLTSLINIISVPATTLTMIATKFTAMHKANNDKAGGKRVVEYLNQKVTKFGGPVFFVAVFATPVVGNFLNIEDRLPIIILWVFMFVSFYFSILNGTLAGWQKFNQVGWTGILGAAFKLVAGVILVKMSFGVSGVMAGFLIGAGASYIASLIVLRFIMRADDAEKETESIDFSSIKNYVMPAFLGNLAINILGNVDMIMAKHSLDSVAAGQYGALTIVSKIIFFATGVIATVLFAMSAEDSHKNNKGSMRIFMNAAVLMLFVCIVSVGAYFLMPNFILGMLFGDKYVNVSHYLGWFAILVTLFSFVNLIFQYLLSIHKTEIVRVFLVIAIISATSILFFGKDFYDILLVACVSQALAILFGLKYLFRAKQDSL